MNTYEFKSESTKIVIAAEDIDSAYNILYCKIQEAADIGVFLPSHTEFYLYAEY